LFAPATVSVLYQLRKRFSACSFAQCVQPRITANVWRKIWPVRFAQRFNERVAALLSNFAIIIAILIIESGIAVVPIFSHKEISKSRPGAESKEQNTKQ
jgi:hypothetical protein